MSAACGATTRTGAHCRKAPLTGNTRCAWHAGARSGNTMRGDGNTRKDDGSIGRNPGRNPGRKPGRKQVCNPDRIAGIYSDLIHAEDRPLLDAIRQQCGAIDDELTIARMQLRRALKAQAQADACPDGMEVYETVEREAAEKVTARNEVKKKLRDHPQIIDRLLARIESLERTRLALRDGSDKHPGALWRFTVRRAEKNGA